MTEMSPRPTSITVIAWLLVALAAISLTTLLFGPDVRSVMEKSPVSPAQYALTYLGLLVTLVCGIAMLKGRNWGRWLYVVWGAVGLLVGIVISPMKQAMIPGAVIFLIITFFLFRPKANRYFSNAEPVRDTQAD
jgi:hypothetical protein